MPSSASAATRLNRHCLCLTLDRVALRRAFDEAADDPAFCAALIDARPTLFSDVAVFVSAEASAQMSGIARAIEAAARLPGYQAAALSWAPEVARIDHGPLGALMGYDFHLGDDGPKLIEVNTNAGGAFLNAPLARAQEACCAGAGRGGGPTQAELFGPAALDMFRGEWRRQRGTRDFGRLAIVDDEPEAQYLYPEFVLAQRLFYEDGIEAVVADGRGLLYEGGVLRFDDQPIDIVYNRLVDFALDRPEHAPLLSAYRDGAVVLTPNPRIHALLADKRDLTLLSDPDRLAAWGLGTPEVEALAAGIPKTMVVTPGNAAALWADRKRHFFKPAAGHGGKAAYRGEKLTKSVWAEIAKGGYVAQAFVPPGGRMVRVAGETGPLKADVRIYTYDGATLLTAARLYQGQATNFRTPGGGFAPVIEVG